MASFTVSSASEVFHAHDPLTKSDITFTAAQSVRTIAMTRRGNGKPPKVCETFLTGRCTAGAYCPDYHVWPEVILQRRNEAHHWMESRNVEFLSMPQEHTFRVFCADLKDIINIPRSALSFTRGLYLDPSIREKRSSSTRVTTSTFAAIAAQVPTVCRLFASGGRQCNWGTWCNQAHVDPGWLARYRDEIRSWSRSLEEQYHRLPPNAIFVVHDPDQRCSVYVQRSAIAEFTRGLLQRSDRRCPSICLLFQRAQCTAGPQCNQVHVQTDWLQAKRSGTPQMAYLDGGGENDSVVSTGTHGSTSTLNPHAAPFRNNVKVEEPTSDAEYLAISAEERPVWARAVGAEQNQQQQAPSKNPFAQFQRAFTLDLGPKGLSGTAFDH